MESRVREIAAQVNNEVADHLAAWFDKTPNLWTYDSYYPAKIKKKNILFNAEIETAIYIAANIPTSTRICEIGIGFGQLSILLAKLGYTVIGVEGAQWRFDGSLHLKNVMQVENYSLLFGMYPEVAPADFDLVLGMNIVNSFWHNWKAEDKRRKVLKGKPGIFDVSLWFEVAGVVAQTQVVQEVENLGYSAKPVFGSVYHFDPKDNA